MQESRVTFSLLSGVTRKTPVAAGANGGRRLPFNLGKIGNQAHHADQSGQKMQSVKA